MFKTESKLYRFFASPLLYKIPMAGLGWIASSAAAYRYLSTDKMIASIVIVCSAIMFILSIGLVVRDQEARKKRNSDLTIEGILHSLYWILIKGGGKKIKDHGLRICVHVPDGENWVQIVDYVGDPRKHGKGTKANVSKGIVGEAIRTGKVAFDSLPRNKNFSEFIVNRYGYTKKEALDRKEDCKSWIAVPVGEPNNLIAVIFCDSTHQEFFGKSNSFRRNVLNSAVLGIAEFSNDR